MKRSAILLLLAVTPGCAFFEPLPPGAPPWTAAHEPRALDDPRLGEFVASCLGRPVEPWPPAAWDTGTLVMAALYWHPDLDVARARLAQAKAGVTTASRIQNPSADVQYRNVSNPEPDTDHTVFASSIMFPVEPPGKRRHRIAQAEHLEEAARMTVERTGWEVRSRVRTAVIDLCEAVETEKLLREQRAVEDENTALLERRAGAGELSPLELPPAEAAGGEATVALAKGRQQTAEARVRLAAAVGVPPAETERIVVDCGPEQTCGEEQPRAELQRRALRLRADILSALADHAACQSALHAELAARFPDIQLGPGYEWDQALNKWGVSASVPLPFLDINQGPIEEARARIGESAARLAALQSQVIGEIDRAFAACAAARREVEAAEQLLEERDRRISFLEAMTRPGEVRRAALYTARKQRIAAAIAAIGARGTLLRANGSLDDAVQRPVLSRGTKLTVPEILSHFRGRR